MCVSNLNFCVSAGSTRQLLKVFRFKCFGTKKTERKKVNKLNVKNRKNKAAVIAIALLFMMTFASLLITLPTANAHTPKWDIPTFRYIHVAPNPVGVNQQGFATFWLEK